MNAYRFFCLGRISQNRALSFRDSNGGTSVRTLLYVAVLVAIASLVLSGCGSISTSLKKAAARERVVEEEVGNYTYETPADEVWPDTKAFFRGKNFDIEKESDTSYFFRTGWKTTGVKNKEHESDYGRERYLVEGKETPSGFQVKVTKVQQKYHYAEKKSEEGEWEMGMFGRHRSYLTEFRIIKQIEPERGKKIQSKVDAAEKEAVEGEG